MPALRVLVITDPINELYGAWPSTALAQLRGAGIDVVSVDLDRLRDPDPIYSALWRPLGSWSTSQVGDAGTLGNPLDVGPATVSASMWLRMLNFKASHRKLIVADDGQGGLVSLVSTADANDGGSAHSNVGLRFAGPLARTILDSELQVARFSGWTSAWQLRGFRARSAMSPACDCDCSPRGAIGRELKAAIDTAQSGESISIAALYLSDREIVRALLKAASRQVRVRLILDPNKDRYGRDRRWRAQSTGRRRAGARKRGANRMPLVSNSWRTVPCQARDGKSVGCTVGDVGIGRFYAAQPG